MFHANKEEEEEDSGDSESLVALSLLFKERHNFLNPSCGIRCSSLSVLSISL